MRACLPIQGRRWLRAVLTAMVLAGCATEGPHAPAPPPLAPGMARVWFLRQSDPTAGNIFAAAPLLYVDRAPLVQMQQGTAFYHDFAAPGRYRLSAQAFGTYSGQHDILHLQPGEVTYVQVLAVGNWELGSPVGGFSFAVLPMAPNVAQAYLPTLADLGAR